MKALTLICDDGEILMDSGLFFGGKYIELIPGKRLRYSDKFEDPNMSGEIIGYLN